MSTTYTGSMKRRLRRINDKWTNLYASDKHGDSILMKDYGSKLLNYDEDDVTLVIITIMFIMMIVTGSWSAIQTKDQPLLPSLAFMLFILLATEFIIIVSAAIIVMRNERAVDSWYDGAYRDSAWYQGLSDDEKVHVTGVLTSKTYRILNNRVKELRESKRSASDKAIQILDKAIANDRLILGENLTDSETGNTLRSMIETYERYRSKLLGDASGGEALVLECGTTDLSHDDEHELMEAIRAYNREAKQGARNVLSIKKYEAMMRKYREKLVNHTEYNHGSPTSQAISDAENLAYAGFTD